MPEDTPRRSPSEIPPPSDPLPALQEQALAFCRFTVATVDMERVDGQAVARPAWSGRLWQALAERKA